MPNSINIPKLAIKAHKKSVLKSRRGTRSSGQTHNNMTTSRTISKKRARLNERNSRYILKQFAGSELSEDGTKVRGVDGKRHSKVVEKLVLEAIGNVKVTPGQEDDGLSKTQRKIRERREKARIENQKALTMGAGELLEDDEMDIESLGNGTTLGKPRVF